MQESIYNLILTLQRLTIPTGNTYHHSHTDYNFQKIVLLVFSYQSAYCSLEWTVNHPNFFPYHGFGFTLGHENGSLEIRIAKHTEFYHVTRRYLAKFFTAGITKYTDRYRTVTKHLNHFILRSNLLNEQQIMNSWSHYPFGMFRIGDIHSDCYRNKMRTILFSKKTAHFLFLTIECTDGIPRTIIRQTDILTTCFVHGTSILKTMDCHLINRYNLPSTGLHYGIL